MAPAPLARVATIPAGAPFLDALARGIADAAAADPLALARMIVLLPTRRACRALREAFLRVNGGAPLLLPRMRPIGDVDEDDAALAVGDELIGELPPAIGQTERLCLLTRLVRERELREGGGAEPAIAARLAMALAQLLDSLNTEEIAFSRLADLAPAELADHWQRTLEFLAILGDTWPQILAGRGQVDASARRVRAIRALADFWRRHPPQEPIYVAGSTGSIPASAALIGVVARLPRGQVVLPGLDLAADDAVWADILREPAHPQHGMAQLLDRIGVAREAVRVWPQAQASGRADRAQLIATALLPPQHTDRWHPGPVFRDSAFAGLATLEATNTQEEAVAVAIALREALETPGRTAALVTPDRALARRVAAELRRWAIDIDDSAGVPLLRTAPASFLVAVAHMIAEDLAPVPLLAALKHRFATHNLPRADWLAMVRRLERQALRGVRPAPGFAGLRAAVRDDAAELQKWLGALESACAKLTELMAGDAHGLTLLEAHVDVAERLSSLDGRTHLWDGDDGEALANFIADLRQAAPALGRIPGRSWPALLATLMEGVTVRPRWGKHPRLFILGPLEARLQQADLMILGGLNEGVWPPEPADDPWLSRPMRVQVGLPPPERRLGLSAHDFAQATAAREVILTRARKREGAPTGAARWWLRLDALLANDPRWPACGESVHLAWARGLDAPPPPPVAQSLHPFPRPPVAARPRRLSVTEVETWNRDPYAIYAKHILGLEPLDPLDEEPGAIERGIALHETLHRFLAEHRIGALPDDALARLLDLGRNAMADLLERPAWRVFWWPRFEAASRWFIAFERQHRAAGFTTLAAERKGELVLSGPVGPFTLRARADRIDLGPDGLAIIDYKTGAAPSNKEVAAGFSPQLPLEAVIARQGGFADVAAAPVSTIAYLELRGIADGGRYRSVTVKRDKTVLDAAALADDAAAALAQRIAAFDDPHTPYLSRPRPQWMKWEGPYDHLARVREWSGYGDES
jgi:ATP-dependent helicase/nuclease subunit B